MRLRLLETVDVGRQALLAARAGSRLNAAVFHALWIASRAVNAVVGLVERFVDRIVRSPVQALLDGTADVVPQAVQHPVPVLRLHGRNPGEQSEDPCPLPLPR